MKKKQNTWGGARPRSGRRRKPEDERTEQVSTRVPQSVIDAIKTAAEDEGLSLSGKAAEILTDWASQPEIPDPEETPLDTAAQFLVAILRRAVEMMDEERREKEE